MEIPFTDILKKCLEENFCREHDIKPAVAINEKSITITCCCPQFHTECSYLATELLEILDYTDWTVQ